MKVRTSVTLPSTLLEEIDRLNSDRSAFFEQAARLYLAQNAKCGRDAKDTAILKRNAERLNREAADVLEYQDPRLTRVR
jgi:metal-responsive CopG/Arc/MetJ family transcriptional regulator